MTGHKRLHAVFVPHKFRNNRNLHCRFYACQLGGKQRQRTTMFGMLAHLRTEVGSHNGLPRLAWLRLFRHVNKGVGDLPESVAQRLEEKLVLTVEMLIEASVSQASVPHHH